jgi:flagellar hook-length control protein FliK
LAPGAVAQAASPAPDGAGVGAPSTIATPPAAAPSAAPAPSAAAASLAQAHGAEITAQLAAQIAQRPTRTAFDFALEPQGLGRVDVSLKFNPQGQLSAVLSFDNPSAAAEARGRASDLRQALQQAGLDVSQGGLSFTSGGGQGHGPAWQSPTPSNASRSPPPVAEAAPTPTLASSPTTPAARGGLDILI